MADEAIHQHSAAGISRHKPDCFTPEGMCPACGAFLPPAPFQAADGPLHRPSLRQPMTHALRRTRSLTGREWAVFQLLGSGYDNRSIARELKISERTVKRHITAILEKLRLESRLQAGITALVISSSTPVMPRVDVTAVPT